MLIRFRQGGEDKSRAACAAFTLAEVLIAIFVLALVMGGMLEGYVQANRMAEYSSMSLAAQSTAQQGVEQALASRWDTRTGSTNCGPGTDDELGLTNWVLSGTNYILDVPVSGAAIPVVNNIYITKIQDYPPLRQIQSDAVWTFPLTGVTYTNTAITQRSPDQ